jgi:hypothetical protein
MADFSLPLGPRTVPGLSYQLLTSHNCNSQPTQKYLNHWSLLYFLGTDRKENVFSLFYALSFPGKQRDHRAVPR